MGHPLFAVDEVAGCTTAFRPVTADQESARAGDVVEAPTELAAVRYHWVPPANLLPPKIRARPATLAEYAIPVVVVVGRTDVAVAVAEPPGLPAAGLDGDSCLNFDLGWIGG